MRRIVPAMLLALLVATGCDQASFGDSRSTQPLPFQADGLKVLLTADGLQNMYQVARGEEFRLTAEPSNLLSTSTEQIDIGPIDQVAAVTIRSAEPVAGRLALVVDFRNVSVPVPVRVRENVEFRVCRVRVRADRVEVRADLALVSGEEGETFDVIEAPETIITGLRQDVLGDCELPDLSATAAPSLEDIVTTYVREAFTSSARDVLETSPLEIMGLIRRRIELVRESPFSNRRGRLLYDGRLGEEAALELGEPGLSMRLDVAAAATRADCAPPVEADGMAEESAATITSDQLEPFGAGVGMALSRSVLTRLAQTSVLSGFACRGLDDAAQIVESPEIIPTDDALLGDLGLDTQGLGPFVRATLSPGDLPTIEHRPQSNTVRLQWTLTLELYGQLQGVWVRLLQVDTTATLNLRPESPSVGSIRFSVESISVSGTDIASKLLAESPPDATLEQWTRRALLLTLADEFEFPLPVEPGTGLRVVGVQVRDTDVLAAMTFEE